MGTDSVEPVTAPGAAIERTYDRVSGLYSRVIGRWDAPTRSVAMELLAPQPGERVLDVGCGPGHAVVDIGRRIRPDGTVTGVDVSRGMLARADRRIHRAGIGPVAGVIRGDARALPILDGQADAIYLAETLELFDRADISQVLAEVTRVLAPDGRLCVVSMPRAGHEDSWFVRGYEWCYRNVPGYATVGCRPIYLEKELRAAEFDIEATQEIRRAGVWPLKIALARPP